VEGASERRWGLDRRVHDVLTVTCEVSEVRGERGKMLVVGGRQIGRDDWRLSPRVPDSDSEFHSRVTPLPVPYLDSFVQNYIHHIFVESNIVSSCCLVGAMPADDSNVQARRQSAQEMSLSRHRSVTIFSKIMFTFVYVVRARMPGDFRGLRQHF
jgi:hypothetical protein